MSSQGSALLDARVRAQESPVAGGRLPTLWLMVGLPMLLRAVPLVLPGGLTGLQEYDDGVHYAASLALTHGQLPYRDFVFLQPPGIAVLLLPFSALGRLVGAPVGMALARIAVLGVAGANTALIGLVARDAVAATMVPGYRVAGRWRPDALAATLAAAGYALAGSAVLAAHTVMLEPLLTLAGLLAARRLLAPDRRGRDLVLAGVLLAVATSIKLWGVLLLAGALCWLLGSGGVREACRVLGAYLAGVAALIGPFALAGPVPLAHDLVLDQVTRPASGVTGVLARLAAITGWSGWQASLPGLPAAGGWLGAALLAALLLLGIRSRVPAARLAGLTGLFLLAAFLLAGPFYAHYAEVVTAPVAILLGILTATPLGRRTAASWLTPRLPVAAALAGVALLTGAFDTTSSATSQPDVAAVVARTVPAGSCTYADDPSLAIAADQLHACAPGPPVVDPRGIALALTSGSPPADLYPAGFSHLAAWQAAVVSRLRPAGFALLLGAPEGHLEWSASTRTYFLRNFTERLGATGPWHVQIWQRVLAGRAPTIPTRERP